MGLALYLNGLDTIIILTEFERGEMYIDVKKFSLLHTSVPAEYNNNLQCLKPQKILLLFPLNLDKIVFWFQ